MKPSIYAYTAPKIHLLRARLARPETIRELIHASQWSDALRLLRDTRLAPFLSASATPIEAEHAVYKALYHDMEKLVKASPREVKPIAEAYMYLVVKKDIIAALRYLLRGEKPSPTVFSLQDVSPLIERMSKELVLTPSTQRMLEYLEKTPLYKPLKNALEAYSSSNSITLFELAVDAYIYTNILSIMRKLDTYGRTLSWRILCPRVDLIALNTVFHGIIARVGHDIMAEAASMLPQCRVTRDTLQKMAESTDFGEAAALLKYTEYGGVVEEGSPMETLRALRRMLRHRIWREANTIVDGIPFHAGYLVAGLELSRIEAEDLISIISGKRGGLSPEEISSYIVIA